MEDRYSKIDSIEVARHIGYLAKYACDPCNDGFSQCSAKRELYLLKCLIDDLYLECPEFPQQEKEWAQSRLITLLKR